MRPVPPEGAALAAAPDGQPAPVAPPDTVQAGQYSLRKILGIWAAATLPMGVLAFVVVPAVIPRTSLHPGLVHWSCMVVGMMWQFVLAMLLLRQDLGRLRWPEIRQRIWWQGPVDPKTGSRRRALYLWAVPAIAGNLLGGWLARPLDAALTSVFPMLREPSYTQIQGLADPQFRGQWWILGLALLSCLFNYVLGEELLFRGVLLPRMNGVFGRFDWVANAVLFGLYHVHKIWFWPSMIASSFGYAWAAKRYRSLWLSMIVHGVESYYVALVFSVIIGWYP